MTLDHSRFSCRPPRVTATHTTSLCASCLQERLARTEAQSPSSEPQLRRAKSYSVRGIPGPATVEEPRRRSCEVRPRNRALEGVFEGNGEDGVNPTWKSGVNSICPEEREKEDGGGDESEREEVLGFDNGRQRSLVVEDFERGGELKTMKEFIDLEWGQQSSKNSTLGDFRGIASVFGKKLMKWKRKQVSEKKNERSETRSVDTEKIEKVLGGNHLQKVESGLGRRSCDTVPRLSLDAGRGSFDEPRATWDRCFAGKSYPSTTPLASVQEEFKAGSGSDRAEEKSPGDCAQTRDYYSASRRRTSFDRSCSIKRGLLEVDEVKAISNVRIFPDTVGLFYGAKLLLTENELRGSNGYSIKSEGVDCASKGHTDFNPLEFGLNKPSRQRRNMRNMWGLMQRKNEKKNGVSGRKSLELEKNLKEDSLAESLQKIRRVASRTASEKLIQSYSISSRKSCDGGCQSLSVERNGGNGPFLGVQGRASPWNSFFRLVDGVDAGKRSCDGIARVFNGLDGGRRSCDATYHRANDALGEANSPNSLFHCARSRDDGRLSFEGFFHQSDAVQRGRRYNRGNLVEGGRRSCDGLIHGPSGAGGGKKPGEGWACGLNGLDSGRKSCDGLIYGEETRGSGTYQKESGLLERSWNARNSPNNHVDNGLLRFYLTPVRSYKRSKSSKSRLRNSSCEV